MNVEFVFIGAHELAFEL